jgi:hypothetical protein
VIMTPFLGQPSHTERGTQLLAGPLLGEAPETEVVGERSQWQAGVWC